MLRTRSSVALPLSACSLVFSLCAAAYCQGFGPEMAGIPGSFGLGAPTSTRQLGMGVMLSCINDEEYANPAFAAIQQAPSAGIRGVTTGFDRGPTTRSLLLHYSQPLRPNETGLQLTIINLSADGVTPLPMMGPVGTRMSENGWVVDYGRRLNPRLTAGLSILGHERVGMSFTPALGPQLMDLVDRADWGARVGATYEWEPGDYIGFIYSYSQDKVETSGVAATSSGSTVFHNNQWALGASRHLSPRLLGALEFQRGTTWREPFGSSDNTWHVGAEYRACREWAVRAGIADGKPTFGFGYDNGRWRADYAFLRDWNDSGVGQLFGGSRTHSLQLMCTW